MRKIVYSVAMSLDGYVAGPGGEADWITMDPEIDFMALFARFDTVLMGRKTYEQVKAMGGGAAIQRIATRRRPMTCREPQSVSSRTPGGGLRYR